MADTNLVVISVVTREVLNGAGEKVLVGFSAFLEESLYR